MTEVISEALQYTPVCVVLSKLLRNFLTYACLPRYQLAESDAYQKQHP